MPKRKAVVSPVDYDEARNPKPAVTPDAGPPEHSPANLAALVHIADIIRDIIAQELPRVVEATIDRRIAEAEMDRAADGNRAAATRPRGANDARGMDRPNDSGPCDCAACRAEDEAHDPEVTKLLIRGELDCEILDRAIEFLGMFASKGEASDGGERWQIHATSGELAEVLDEALTSAAVTLSSVMRRHA